MSKVRANSYPELLLPSSNLPHHNDSILEGVAANVKLLLKLIHDHHEASGEEDGRKPQRIAGMMTILDDVKSRIEKSQFSGKREAELRRCNTDLRRGGGAPVKERKPPQEATAEEHQKLRRELSASMTARKSLEKMFSSLGKEKEMIAGELARKVQELTAMEELTSDLRAQNEMLTEKVNICAAEHRGKKNGGDPALQERNKALSEQLLKALDGYRSLKRRYKDSQSKMAEMAEEAAAAKERVHGLREKVGEEVSEGMAGEIEEELSLLEGVFDGFHERLLKGSPKGSPNKVD